MTDNITPLPVVQVQSQRFSFTGYSFKTWAIKNKDSLQNVLAAVVGISTYLSTNLNPVYKTLVTVLASSVTIWVTNLIDYWQSE